MLHEGQEIADSGQYFAIKNNHSSKAGRTLFEGREVTGSGQYFAVKNNHSGEAGKTLHERREVTGSVHYLAIKKTIWQKQIGHCIRDKRFQVEDSIMVLKTTTLARHVFQAASRRHVRRLNP